MLLCNVSIPLNSHFVHFHVENHHLNYQGFSEALFWAGNQPLSKSKKKINFPNFQLKTSKKKWMRIPISCLQKLTTKAPCGKLFFHKETNMVPQLMILELLHIQPAQLSLCVPHWDINGRIPLHALQIIVRSAFSAEKV